MTDGSRRATAAAGLALLLAGAVAGRLTAPDAAAPPAPPLGSGPGPASAAGSVPTGYARTQEGAVAAATTYLAALSGRTVLDTAARKAALDAVVLPSARAAVEPQFRVDAAGAQASGLTAALVDGSLVARTIPAGSRVRSYTPEAASVEVWSVSLLGTRTLNRVGARWRTTTVEMRWDGSDWKLAGIDGRSGPVPSAGADVPSRFDDVLAGIDGMKGYSYAPRE